MYGHGMDGVGLLTRFYAVVYAVRFRGYLMEVCVARIVNVVKV